MGIFNWGKEIEAAGDGVNSAFKGIGDSVGGIIDSAKGQIPPAAQGEIEKLKIEVDGELRKAKITVGVKVQEILANAQKAVYDFALQYEGSADKVPQWVLIMRSIIRPIITIYMFASFALFSTIDAMRLLQGEEMGILAGLPSQYWWMLGIIVGFWFGSKGVENAINTARKPQ